MIHGLWIIKKTGECIFERPFDTKAAPDISSLLSAIHTFADSISEESVSSITLENVLFRYKMSRDIIFVLATDKEDEVSETLDSLEVKFWSELKQPLTEITDKEKFENFAREADEIIREYERKKEIEDLDDKLRSLERDLV
ncbi:MAG: hypothetical protein ACTSSA_06125 [Candidatus Freyarchaeota archaeon]|nr:hypothetical protein [Candidatus Sigynarchaeota archaeon]